MLSEFFKHSVRRHNSCL